MNWFKNMKKLITKIFDHYISKGWKKSYRGNPSVLKQSDDGYSLLIVFAENVNIHISWGSSGEEDGYSISSIKYDKNFETNIEKIDNELKRLFQEQESYLNNKITQIQNKIKTLKTMKETL